MPYGVPRGFFLQNIVYAYFLVFEKEKSRSKRSLWYSYLGTKADAKKEMKIVASSSSVC